MLNCAAYTKVDLAEQAADLAELTNAAGARHVAVAAARHGGSGRYVSIGYVFDGSSDRPYVESDDVGPLSIHGALKVGGERETAAATDRHHVVRSSWLFGTGGHNFVETMLKAGAEKREVTVVDDQVGSPTYCKHLADGLLELSRARRTASTT